MNRQRQIELFDEGTARRPDHYGKIPIAEILLETDHLDECAFGIYIRLYFHYRRKRRPLPDDPEELARIAHCSVDNFRRFYSAKLASFFRKKRGKWHHKGIDRQIKEANSTSESARKSAKARWMRTQEELDFLRRNLPEKCRDCGADSTVPQPCERNANALSPREKANSLTANLGDANALCSAMLSKQVTSKLPVTAPKRASTRVMPALARVAGEERQLEFAGIVLGSETIKQHGGLLTNCIREDMGRVRRVLEELERQNKDGVKPRKTPIARFLYHFKTFSPSPGRRVLKPLQKAAAL